MARLCDCVDLSGLRVTRQGARNRGRTALAFNSALTLLKCITAKISKRNDCSPATRPPGGVYRMKFLWRDTLVVTGEHSMQ
jgi:hypothetical protein